MYCEVNVRRRRKRPVIAAAAAGLIALCAIAVWVNAALKKPLADMAGQRVRERVELALHTAVAQALDDGAAFDILSVRETGEETFVINADTLALNRIINTASLNAGELVSEMGAVGAGVELFQAWGLAALSGSGPVINARFSPIGAVGARPVSRLASAGINQCHYTLSVELTASVRVVAAGRTLSVEVKNTVPIAETVIVGKTPQVYTNVANEEDMLNLIPTEAGD